MATNTSPIAKSRRRKVKTGQGVQAVIKTVGLNPNGDNQALIVAHRAKKGFDMTRMVHCIKLGKEAEGLGFQVYPGELGKKIFDNVSKEAWADWIKLQTMLVNENRLNLADARARDYLKRQMENHFFGGGADAAAGYVPPTE